MLALVIMTGASFCLANADGKKDKKKKKNEVVKVDEVVEPVVLQSQSDSVSYAMGMEMTNGLIPFLIDQMGVDTAYMYKFIEGFEDAINKEKNNKEITAYGAGVNIAHMVNGNMITNARKNMNGVTDSIGTDMFDQGFLAALNKNYLHFNDTSAAAYISSTREAHLKKNQKAGEAFLAENAKKEGVVTLPSGLQYKILRQGNGPVATSNDEVEVKYEGKLIDGTVFDSSYTRSEQTNKFRPNQVIKGWTEALTLMPEGSMWELYIPQELAYGERQAGQIPPYSALIFKVEVEKVFKPEVKATETPATTVKKSVPVKKTVKTKK